MTKQARGWQGAVLKVMGAPDFELTVTGRQQVTSHFVRLNFDAGGLLVDRTPHPTMWIRLWFSNGGKVMQQRAYTVINPDVEKGTFDLDFAIHDGPAPNWAQEVEIGGKIAATVMGSKFAVPEPDPKGFVIVGDTASLPAINTLLGAINGAPAKVWLESQHDDDTAIPVAATKNTEVRWVPREGEGKALVAAVEASAFDASGYFGWVACDMKTTRATVGVLKNKYKLDKKSIKSQGYWMVGRTPF